MIILSFTVFEAAAHGAQVVFLSVLFVAIFAGLAVLLVVVDKSGLAIMSLGIVFLSVLFIVSNVVFLGAFWSKVFGVLWTAAIWIMSLAGAGLLIYGACIGVRWLWHRMPAVRSAFRYLERIREAKKSHLARVRAAERTAAANAHRARSRKAELDATFES